jgi:hypothetical protein
MGGSVGRKLLLATAHRFSGDAVMVIETDFAMADSSVKPYGCHLTYVCKEQKKGCRLTAPRYIYVRPLAIC